MNENLLASAQIYYDYLEQNGLGVEKIRIKSFELNNSKLLLVLGQKLWNIEGLLLRIEGREIYVGDEEEVVVRSYDEQKQILILEFLTPIHPLKDFELFSDLKFLIQNVKEFFLTSHIALPSKSPFPLDESKIPKERLSEEQVKAMRMVFSSPLSYIWGAPGSGKTQRVLFESLLYLIQNDKKVALIAPTNYALEQALKTIIRKADDLQLNRLLFLRFGVPSAEFLAFYPECCDTSVLDRKQLSLFSISNPKERFEEARVVAMTLDGFIKRYASLRVCFDHIFLDECGFAPLIKACALCANDSALTLLGDHKQLMPVCEMPAKELERSVQAKLWSLSALFLESFFTLGDEIFSQKTLELKYTKTAVLKHTYRYGNNLARILDTFIYKNGLKGNEWGSEIYYVDCGKNTEQAMQINLKEVEAIVKLLPQIKEEYAIITPFVKQRQLLIQQGISYEKIFTIHRSQGQEFDCVIFSPVGLHYHLTDSKNPLALQALNVAISRVKKRLILVCDVSFWKQHPDQFLSSVLSCAMRQ